MAGAVGGGVTAAARGGLRVGRIPLAFSLSDFITFVADFVGNPVRVRSHRNISFTRLPMPLEWRLDEKLRLSPVKRAALAGDD
jgi:hypothetical protein